MRKGTDEIPSKAQGVELPYLRAWRFYKLMSMRDLSDRSGVSTNTINALENKKSRARFATLGKLARAMEITPDQLAHQQPPTSEGRRAVA